MKGNPSLIHASGHILKFAITDSYALHSHCYLLLIYHQEHLIYQCNQPFNAQATIYTDKGQGHLKLLDTPGCLAISLSIILNKNKD